ncbi:MAG: right-handed parallel beta-helix repeat-containing protein [Planctomycetota bacterium]
MNRKLALVGVLGALLVMVTPLSGQASPDGAKPQPVGGQSIVSTEGCESQARAASLVQRERPPLDPIVARLHEARRLGDDATVEALEAYLKRPLAAGESNGAPILRPTTSFGGRGCPVPQNSPQGFPPPLGEAPSDATFGPDVHVRGTWSVTAEWNPSLASDSKGNLYVAWQDNAMAYDYIQLYWSQDSGNSWDSWGYVLNPAADLTEPSIAIGEGATNRLVLAYIVDDGVSMPYPEVATAPLDSGTFTIRSVPVWSWEAYRHPVIWTDSFDFSGWYAYLTCEGVYDVVAKNINVCFWRSTDRGSTWPTGTVVLGNYDTYPWTDPDGTYGTNGNRVFLGCFRDDNNTLYCVRSDDFGLNWNPEVEVATLDPEPFPYQAKPQIAAAVNHDNVMLCCTKAVAGYCWIGQTYSTNAGEDWTTVWTLEGRIPGVHAFAVALTANEGGGSWHLAYTTSEYHVYYSHRPQDLSDFWQSEPDRVDDLGTASEYYRYKGIASNWTTDACGIVWSDFRDGSGDYDIYYDYTGNDLFYHVPSEIPTIQGAIDVARTGGTVLVAPGTYSETIDFLGKAIAVRSTEGAQHTTIDAEDQDTAVKFVTGEGPDSILEDMRIANGSALMGGGIYCSGASPTIRNCVIIYNAADYGGGIFLYESDAILTNNTVTENWGIQKGGGIYIKSALSAPLITNTILWDDTSPDGPEIYVDAASPNIRYCDVEGGWAGTGNINSNPLFVEEAADDHHIQYNSPCREAGWSGAPGLPDEDFDGNPRRVYSRPDIGADEFCQHLYYSGVASPGQTIKVKFTGTPGTSPVALLLGSGVLDEPVWGPFGYWYLMPPIFGPYYLPAIPSPSGVESFSGTIPPDFPSPFDLPMQAYIGTSFTDLCVIHVN